MLTGSEQFPLSDAISQSLAGRTALIRLLPFSLTERLAANATDSIERVLFEGFYPRIHDQRLDPRQALGDYLETYVERDVRRLGGVRNLSGFRMFTRLCAGRIGQLVNLSSLGADDGVSHTTARQWLTVLERSYIVFRLRPFHANLRKRLVKAPKLYFYDAGLASYLIGIERADQIVTHPLRGALFENTVVVEALEHRFNTGRRSNLFFLSRCEGSGMRPPVPHGRRHRGHRAEVRRHDRRRCLPLHETCLGDRTRLGKPSAGLRWSRSPISHPVRSGSPPRLSRHIAPARPQTPIRR